MKTWALETEKTFRRGEKGAKVLVLVLGLCGGGTQLANAATFDYFNDFDKYGVQENFTCPGPGSGGVCAAVAAINSFIFLQNEYPNIYDNKLVPNYDPMTNTSMMDAEAFADTGWQAGSNPMRLGYYQRALLPGFDAEEDYLDTKKDWFNDYAPGTTVFDSWFEGSPDNDRKPTIEDLAKEIKDGEDVEFFVDDGNGFFHALTLTGVFCDMAMNCGIKYQDPNQPTVEQDTLVSPMNGMLMFTGVPGSGFAGTVTITAAFAESPRVPEPSTILGILAVGSLGAISALKHNRKQHKRAGK
jgi:hypothetical protein